jgi:predicted Zn-dependent protease with MMP-like domain
MTARLPFEEHVKRALDSLPPELARALKNVAVVIEEQDHDDPDLLGLWEADEFMPDKITIFRRPLIESFPDPTDLEREIRITVLHELAHYFGIDEDRLEELGYD